MFFAEAEIDNGSSPHPEMMACQQMQENQEACWQNLAEKLLSELSVNQIKLQQEIAQRQQIESERDQLAEKLEENQARSRALMEASTAQAQQFSQTLKQLRQNQAQIIQTEKMASLGQLVAGVAHEINNPVNFIYGNLPHATEYAQDLMHLLQLYRQHYPHPASEIATAIETIDLDFLAEDLPKLLTSMRAGAERIQKIVLSLRNFSRLDEAEMKVVDIHEGIESTLMILQNRLKAKPNHLGIQVIREYENLPLVECYAGQINQVLMNILNNAIDALEERDQQRSLNDQEAQPSTIRIKTSALSNHQIAIQILDNGCGIPEQVQQRIFDPFFTTKPVGKGMGLGMSISYQIVTEKHGGQLYYHSTPEQGTEFVIQIPIQRQPTTHRTAHSKAAEPYRV